MNYSKRYIQNRNEGGFFRLGQKVDSNERTKRKEKKKENQKKKQEKTKMK